MPLLAVLPRGEWWPWKVNVGQASSAVIVGASILAPTRCHPAICSTFLKQIFLDLYTQLDCIHGSAEVNGGCAGRSSGWPCHLWESRVEVLTLILSFLLLSLVYWLTPKIPALKKQRQKGHVPVCNIASSRLAWAPSDPLSQKLNPSFEFI